MARPRSFDENKVLLAVRDHFWDAGYAATSLDDLMRVSSLGKGSLYAAFGDKHTLFLKALRSYGEEQQAALRDHIDSAPRAVDALRMLIMSPTADTESASRGCLLVNAICELAGTDPDLRTEATRAYESLTAVIIDLATRAQHEGDIPSTTDPLTLAREILTIRHGLICMRRAGLDPAILSATARSLADRLL